MSKFKAQAQVYATLGDYQTLKSFVETNLLLTPVDLWEIYQGLPEDLDHTDTQSKIKAIQVARAIVKHPNLAPEQVLFFLSHKKTCLKQRALVHPNFPDFMLNKLVQDLINEENSVKLNKVLENPSVSSNFVDQILDKALWRDEEVFENTRNYICKHACTNRHFAFIESLTKLSVKDHLVLLDNPHTSENLLNNLADFFWNFEKFYTHPNVSYNAKKKALNFVKNNVPHLYNKFSTLAQIGAMESLTKSVK